MNKRLATIVLAPIFLISGLSSHAAAGDSDEEAPTEDRLGESPIGSDTPETPETPNTPETPDTPDQVSPDGPKELEPEMIIRFKFWGFAPEIKLYDENETTWGTPLGFYDPKGDLGKDPVGEDRR